MRERIRSFVRGGRGIRLIVLVLALTVLSAPVRSLASEAPEQESGSLTGEDGFSSGFEELQQEELEEQALADPDKLFEEYASSKLYGARRRHILADGSAKLSGVGLEVYTVMRDRIRDVANGVATSSKFRIPVAEYLEKTVFTAEDLGMEPSGLTDENGNVTREALSAVFEKTGWNHKAVLLALLADSPYEFYWYDKTSNFLYGNFAVEPRTEADGATVLAVPANAEILYYLPVAADYAADTEKYDYENGDLKFYLTLKAEKTQAAAAAVKTAREIVDEAADYSDIRKLSYYRSKICDLASYDGSASAVGYAYGDPWQIISVFDGDNETKVVCEGYAKAFQYLCDLTVFDTEITCLSVTGTMKGGTGEGRHMWNVVQFPDGENYLVDLTNCDTGTLGEPDKLFLAGTDTVGDDYTFYFQTDGGGISYHYDSDTMAVYGPEDLYFADHPAHTEHLCTGSPELVTNEDTGVTEVEYTCGLCGFIVRETCNTEEGEER